MTVKEYLSQVWDWNREIKRLLDSIAHLRARAESYGIFFNTDKLGVQENNPIHDTQAEIVTMMADEEAEYWRIVRKHESLCAKIESQIMQLTDCRHREILGYRYLQFMKWEDIWDRVRKPSGGRYAEIKDIFRLHGKALESFEKIKNDIE